MLTPATAAAAIAAGLPRAATTELPLASCAGHTLRQEIVAERDAPPFDRVAMDGIAILAAAVADGRREFRIAGTQGAGALPLRLPSPGDCIEIMTGASLPAGCDAVIPVERIRVADGIARLEDGYAVAAWQNVHRRGSDARAGGRLLGPGALLRGPEIAIAASAGLTALCVDRRPRIAVISTGDELVPPGQPIQDHQLRRSNPQGLAAALALAGFAPQTDRHLPDRRDELLGVLGELLDHHEVLVLSGGVSAGRYDFVPGVLGDLGVERVFHKIAQRPGGPMWFGVRPGGAAVFALPGNPVSVLVCLGRYVLPALRAASGAPAPPPRRVALAEPCEVRPALAFFLPVVLEYDGSGRTLARPRPTRGSGDFVSLGGTDGFVELPPGPAVHPAGLGVTFYHWQDG
ncbi:MAG: molybdopterin molybdotransferase MoeA [Gammaproteobacteria bacterium]|nr:molybdopterin molybdotransferase MoeA [Gammaproteobacteria bacterium]